MKSFTTLYLYSMRSRSSRRNLRVLPQFVLLLLGMILVHSSLTAREYRGPRDCDKLRPGCSVIAIHSSDGLQVNPDPNTRLPADAEIFVIGTAESEQRFLDLNSAR